jgi:hypothetical protein
MTFDSAIHFFTLPQDENAEPTVLIVGDLANPFVPMPFSKLMLNAANDKERLNGLIERLYNYYNPDYYAQSRLTHNSAVGSALKACMDLLDNDGKQDCKC